MTARAERLLAPLAPAELADARAGAYALLADLLAHGVTDATRRAAESSPSLARALARYRQGEPDALAADHHRAFDLEVFPYEGVFLDAGAQVGGAAAAGLGDLYRRMGFSPDPRTDDPEHLATILRALAVASGTEARILSGRVEGAVETTRELTRELTDAHLLRWLPLFTTAARSLPLPFPAALAVQIEDLVLAHRDELGPPPSALAPAADPIALEDHVGLADLGRALAAPARAGLFLTRTDLASVGASARVPRGFGGRARTIENLLRTASDLDALPEVVAGLTGPLDGTGIALAHRTESFPWLEPFVTPHRERIAHSRKLLAHLVDEAHASATGGPG